MTKDEQIERYGLEWYNAYKEKSKLKKRVLMENPLYKEKQRVKSNEINKKRYALSLEYREYQKKFPHRKYFVKDGKIELIENYELAKADNFKGWDIHHKLEINDDYINSKEELIMMNLYYNRPPEELIWMKHNEHQSMHSISRWKKLKD
jgi:hypothetical protein